jgi:hypothetical protein
MLILKEIHERWKIKINNYMKKYVRRNRLTFAEVKSQFFIETQFFLGAIPEEIKKYIDRPTHE